MSCVFVVSSLPAIVVDGSKSFSFRGCSLVRIVCLTTPVSVSLVHGFTHDESVPCLFSTPIARSQQQTEILIHLLKKLAPVNDIRGVLYLVDPMWIFSLRIWKELQFKGFMTTFEHCEQRDVAFICLGTWWILCDANLSQ